MNEELEAGQPEAAMDELRAIFEVTGGNERASYVAGIDTRRMIVMGFVEPFTKELPMEYAVELNRLIAYEMEGSVG